MIKKIKDKIDRIKLKNEIKVHKGMIAELMESVNWNEEHLTLEDRLRLNKLIVSVKMAEEVLSNC